MIDKIKKKNIKNQNKLKMSPSVFTIDERGGQSVCWGM
jgi:hypothetical protein